MGRQPVKRFFLFLTIYVGLWATADETTQFSRAQNSENTSALEMGVTLYSNPNSKIVVTVIPITHVGQNAYYDVAEKILDGHDIVLYEGVRPSGFFGPPFEDDPTIETEDDYTDRTHMRLFSLLNLVRNWEKKHKSKAQTWDEVLGIRKDLFLKKYLFDTWGRPIFLQILKDGRLEAMSLGPNPGSPESEIRMTEQRIFLRRNLLAKVLTKLMGFYKIIAKNSALDLQSDHTGLNRIYEKPSSYNIDVSNDQLFDIPLWKVFEVKQRWKDRFAYPVQRMKEALTSLDPSQGTRVAILYGAGHAKDFHEGLIELGFQIYGQTWFPIIEVREGEVLSQTASKSRMKLITQLGKKSAACAELLGGSSVSLEDM